MAEGNAALPWAAQQAAVTDTKQVQDTDAATTVAEEDLQPISIQQLGLEPGARIEVMWEVTTEEGAEASSRWFAATISCNPQAQAQPTAAPATDGVATTATDTDTAAVPEAAAGPPSTSGAPSKQLHQQYRYTLRYDGSDEFPEEIATVMLLSEHELYDAEKRDCMFWRREGDPYEPPEEEESDEEGAVLNGRDIEMCVSAEEAEQAEAQMIDRLSSMTQDEGVKADLVAGYNDFKNQFKAFIAAKAACADGDVLITTSDVEEFKAMMNTQRATAAAHRR